jgi:hypothetical protein
MFQFGGRTHTFHAEAKALHGEITSPIHQVIHPQATASLLHTGGYQSQSAHAFSVEKVLSYASAHTQVGGNLEEKPGHGWSTIATAVVENLNIMEVVTADRVVAQVSTEHPLKGHIPSITFLGTRFENLRIAGHPVKLDLDLNIVGRPPEGDLPYTSDRAFLTRVENQYKRLHDCDDLPSEVRQRYNQVPTGNKYPETVQCSLVNQANGAYPAQTYGHAIVVPNFGTIFLATLRLLEEEVKDEDNPKGRIQTTFDLTMIEVEMGCIGAGRAAVATTRNNGSTAP